MAQPTTLVIKRATQEQIYQTLRNNYGEWGAPQLNLNQYFDRENSLKRLPFAAGGNLICWVLVPCTDQDTLDIYSACETYRRPCIIKMPNLLIQEKYCYSVASVFTPENYRHRGFASQLMSMLLNELKADENAIGSTLYSDVGPEFYAKLGWRVFPSLTFTSTIDIASSKLDLDFGDYQLINDSTYWEKSVVRYHDHVLEQMEKASKEQNSTIFHVACTIESIQWRLERAIFYAKVLGKRIYTSGAVLKDGSFGIWYHNFKENILEIICLHHENAKATDRILHLAAEECRKCALEKLTVWDLSFSRLSTINMKGKSEERTDALFSLCLFDSKIDHLILYNNEHYAWV